VPIPTLSLEFAQAWSERERTWELIRLKSQPTGKKKTQAAISRRIAMWFSTQLCGHVCPREAELEGMERAASAGDWAGGCKVVSSAGAGGWCFLTA